MRLRTNQMMFQEGVNIGRSLYHKVLIAALVVFVQDLSVRRGAQAWTYTHNVSPNRKWHEARQWCQDNFGDMAIAQNQEEIDFLNNFLPFNQRYYWIGVHKVAGVWTWPGRNESVPEEDQNWAPEEPDSIVGQDCVEIYIKRDKDTGKWNNEKCLKRKGTVCYTASCTKGITCSSHSDCVETIGNYTCRCHPGFTGPRCEEAIACQPLSAPKQGSYNCFDPYGSNRFNSSCQFLCELGFQLEGVSELLCQASGRWNQPVPLCQVQQCPLLNYTSLRGRRVNCSHPIAPHSYNSTCEIRCDEGYELSGPDQILCDHTGQWTASIPACKIKKCSPILFPAVGNATCVDTLEPFSFGSQCDFTCPEGYYLRGDSTLTCLASGVWSKPTPTCTVVQCNSLEAPPAASLQCEQPLGLYSYDSVCVVQCEEGFDLIGTNVTKCSSQGNWSHTLPVCQAKKCPALNSSTHGSLSCSKPHGEFRFGSRCTSVCEDGFLPNGTVNTECTSLGTWTADVPRCLAKRCPSLISPPHGSLACSDPYEEFSFRSQCTSSCDEGFVLNGTADNECTSQGMWSGETPQCLARLCPLLVDPPQHGRMNCGHPYSPFSYGSQCDFTCEDGFSLRGPPAVTCNNSGHWSRDLPTCQPVQCEPIQALSLLLSMNCSHPLRNFSFGSQCLFTCEDGFSLNGTELLLCSSTGFWSDSLPTCTDWPVGNTMMLHTGVGAASVVIPIVLIGLALLILMQYKKRGNRLMSEVPAWEDRENPAFES
uniref:E-selectin n=2 Tax=Anabas testudineus TaxID=64144 RepID=A0A3Q1HB59_ANATE